MSVAGRGRGAAGGHRVEPARMPRMAARDTLYAEPAAAQHAESANGLQGILRARGLEPAARAEKRAEGPLIAADQADREEAHRSITIFHSSKRLSCSAAPVAPRALGRALTTRSTGGRVCWCSRNDSRMIRRMRLRSTALPAVRTATAMPSRAPCLSLLLAVTAKNPLPKRRPRAYAASNSDLRRRRLCAGKVSRCIVYALRPAVGPVQQISVGPARTAERGNLEVGAFPEPLRGSASAALWRGGGPAPCGRSGSPCVPGTRACACGAAC